MKKLEEQELSTAEDVVEIDEEILQQKDDSEKVLQETIKKIKETASEEDPRPSQQVNLRTILGGDILTAEMVRSQIWLFVLIVAFTIVYVAFRYQCQQDMQAIDRLETQVEGCQEQSTGCLEYPYGEMPREPRTRYFETKQGLAVAYCRPASLYYTITRIKDRHE